MRVSNLESPQHIINWLVFIVLVGLISWLVVVDFGRSGTSYHLESKNGYSDSICVNQRSYIVISGCGYEVIQ